MYTRTSLSAITIHTQATNTISPACLDCLFWYRCRGAKIDCELNRHEDRVSRYPL